MVSPGWADRDRGLFSISVAAELAGLHPQTLRIYEREGLLDPGRSAGGTRRYSARDMDRLQEICALTADGLNLAGIRRVLQLQEETRHLQAELDRLRTQAASSRKLGVRAQAGPGPRTGCATGRSGLALGRQLVFPGQDAQGGSQRVPVVEVADLIWEDPLWLRAEFDAVRFVVTGPAVRGSSPS